MGSRKKWYAEAIVEYLENGGADGIGCATSHQLREMLFRKGRRTMPRVGAISQTLRGLFNEQGEKLATQVGFTKIARGESRVRGYNVAVWSLIENPHMDKAMLKYFKNKTE